jgi:hypothetical protein
MAYYSNVSLNQHELQLTKKERKKFEIVMKVGSIQRYNSNEVFIACFWRLTNIGAICYFRIIVVIIQGEVPQHYTRT